MGYLPRYLAQDVYELLKQDPKRLQIYVERVNPVPTPIQLRLLCNLTAEWTEDFQPFSSQDYLPIVDKVVV